MCSQDGERQQEIVLCGRQDHGVDAGFGSALVSDGSRRHVSRRHVSLRGFPSFARRRFHRGSASNRAPLQHHNGDIGSSHVILTLLAFDVGHGI